MKPSLEDERRALLEQIEASRAVYRRMLSGEPDISSVPGRQHVGADTGQARVGSTRQSRLMVARDSSVQWVLAHPLWVVGGVALLVLLAPRLISGTRAAARHRAARHQTVAASQDLRDERSRSGGTLRALLTVTTLLLRDPARLRAAARMAGSAWQWLQRRRHARVAASPLPDTRAGKWPY